MRLIDKIATIWCIVALAGIFIFLTVNLVAYYVSGANMPPKHPDWPPVSRNMSYEVVFGIHSARVAASICFILLLWAMAGTASVLFLGFYFVVTATDAPRRVLAALCFLWPWALLVIMRSPPLIAWFLD